MAIRFEEIYEEKSRTAAPASTSATDIQAKGAKEIRAFWRIAAATSC